MKKKILILGGRSFLAQKLFKFFKNNKRLAKQYELRKSYKKIQNNQSLVKIIDFYKPNMIINCIAYTNVDMSEKFKRKAVLANSKVPKWLGNILKINKKIFLIHISTDHVYSASKNIKNKINNTNPINMYAKSKLDGEKYLQKTRSIILRTNFIGKMKTPSKISLCYWMKSNLQKKKMINGFNNIFFNPIHINTLSSIIFKILNKPIIGTYNVGCKEIISKYHYLKKLSKMMKLDNTLITKKTYTKKKNCALRPRFMGTDTENFFKTYKIKQMLIDQEIKINYLEY